MRWQQLGSNLAFVAGMIIVGRRHLRAVLRRAFFLSGDREDADEPVSYAVSFWGFVLTIAGCVVWQWLHGMSVLVAAAAIGLVFCWYVAYMRVVAQGGVYVTRVTWSLPNVLQGITGRVGGAGALITSTLGMFLGGATIMLAPVAMDAFRVSSAIERRRRWFMPALMASIVVALLVTTYMMLRLGYSMGALNFSFTWAAKQVPISVFSRAQAIITQPSQAKAYPGPLSFGIALTGFVMFMRARFYWWPIHPIGLLACNSWHAHRLWFPFFLGWLTKTSLMRFSGGQHLRAVRHFFVAFIIMEVFISGVSALISVATGGVVPTF
jgi:hypothetical protein